MRYAIYPPIGLARVGNHPTGYFIGPEMPEHPGMEPDGKGSEAPVKEYKVDEDEIKRQAARFRLFAIPETKGAHRSRPSCPPGRRSSGRCTSSTRREPFFAEADLRCSPSARDWRRTWARG